MAACGDYAAWPVAAARWQGAAASACRRQHWRAILILKPLPMPKKPCARQGKPRCSNCVLGKKGLMQILRYVAMRLLIQWSSMPLNWSSRGSALRWARRL